MNQLLNHFKDLRTDYPGKVRLGTLSEFGEGTELPELVAAPGPLLDHLFKDFESLEARAEDVPWDE